MKASKLPRLLTNLKLAREKGKGEIEAFSAVICEIARRVNAAYDLVQVQFNKAAKKAKTLKEIDKRRMDLEKALLIHKKSCQEADEAIEYMKGKQ